MSGTLTTTDSIDSGRRRWRGCLALAGLVVWAGSGSATRAGEQLRYDWKPGQEYVYSVNVVESGRNKVQQRGVARFRADEVPAHQEAPEQHVSQGTGLVVNSRGYLLTCAHVVRDAARIEITLGEKKYPATLVAQDREHDLALLHAEATDWPVLQLGDSERLELGQEVRVVGFPLSRVLGSSIKITRGILSGIIVEGGEKLLQVDAGINHGNSGGPLVNEQGEVVGVVSAILNPQLGSNVGFAQPINEARKLLDAQGVAWQAAGSAAKLEGAELAKRVIPSVAYILVTPRPETSTWRKLAYRVEMGPKPQTGFYVVDAAGGVHEENGEGMNISMLGTIGFEPLAREGERQWQTEHAISFFLRNVESMPAVGPGSLPEFGPGSATSAPSPIASRGRLGPQPGQTRTTVISIPGVERARFEVLNATSATVTIKKNTTVSTMSPGPGKPPWLSAQGEGIFEFDRAAGVVRSFTFTAKVAGGVNPADTHTRTLTYQRLEGNKLASLPVMPPQRSNASAGGPGLAIPGAQSPGVPGGVAAEGSRGMGAAPNANRVELPNATARGKAEKLLEDLFEKDLAALDTPAKRVVLARQMLKQAGDQRPGSADHYVLLDKARDLAVIGGDASLACQAVDQLADCYQVDGRALKSGALATLAETFKSTSQQRRIAMISLNLLDQAIADDDADAGRRLGKIAYAAAHKSEDKALIAQTAERGKAFKSLQKDYDEFQKALATLKNDPKNAAASAQAGRYYCLVKDDWARGLPLLAQGNDSQLANLAAQELAAPLDGNAQFELAEGWSDLARRERGGRQARVRLHARAWYERALPSLSGLARSKAEQSLTANPAVSAEPPGDAAADRKRIFEWIAQANRDGHLSRTRDVGNTVNRETFSVVPEQGALLIGFDVHADETKIVGLRPIFSTARGHALGPWCGIGNAKPQRIIAKSGYAVGALNIQAQSSISGIAIQFMEIGAAGLDSTVSYQSEWLGHAPSAGSGTRIDGGGAVAVGIHGHTSVSQILSLGLVLAPKN